MALFLTSCVSLDKQFVKNKVKSAELCKSYFPIKEIKSKEVVRYKTDTITIKGDSIECPIERKIKDTIEIDKKVIIKDTTTEILLNDREFKLIDTNKKVKELESKLQKKNNHLFYIKNKTKL